ncbi:MAG TPA: archaemetzincin family Zn-dependent metalloprotease [archaeon]|nr:archaemetzincin family Zn-dependent metalloprotease [archaeon]
MKALETIYISPVNFKDNELFESLSHELSRRFGFPCAIFPLAKDLSFAFNPDRGQYHSTKIFRLLGAEIPEDGLRILIVVHVDLYVPELRFVFGEAEIGGPAAIISLARLWPEFYRLKPDRTLFKARTVKEAVHELGHTFGLAHCGNPSCVMFFSNSLLDTDRKKSDFCPACRKELLKLLDKQF